MNRCSRCNSAHRNSKTFCSENAALLVEFDIQPKSIGIHFIIFAAAAFIIAFGAMIWAQSQTSAVSRINAAPISANRFFNENSGSSNFSKKVKTFDFAAVQTSPSSSAKNNVDVLVEYFTSTKSNSHPMPNEPIVLQAGDKSFNAVTNDRGFARFSSVPCGKQTTISFTGEPSRSFSRSLSCKGTIAKWRYYFNAYKEFNSLAIEQIR